jgi:hypothetical protein
MKNKSNKTSEPEDLNTIDGIYDGFKKLASVKGMSFFVKRKPNKLVIGAKPFHILYIVLYSIYFAFPIILFDKDLSGIYILLILYYSLFILLIWNISRTSKKLIFDFQNNTLSIHNNNILGQFLRKKVDLNFNEITDFEVEYLTNRNKSKTYNQIYVITTRGNKVLLIKLIADGASLRMGNRFVELTKNMIDL